MAVAFPFSLSFSSFLFTILFLLFSIPAQMPPVRIMPRKKPRKILLEVIVVDKYKLNRPTLTYEVVSVCQDLSPRWAPPPVDPAPSVGHTGSTLLGQERPPPMPVSKTEAKKAKQK